MVAASAARLADAVTDAESLQDANAILISKDTSEAAMDAAAGRFVLYLCDDDALPRQGVPDEDHPPFGRIEVDPYLCIGCQKCISKGPDGAFLDGCPWDAIEMVPTEDWEAAHGVELTLSGGSELRLVGPVVLGPTVIDAP